MCATRAAITATGAIIATIEIGAIIRKRTATDGTTETTETDATVTPTGVTTETTDTGATTGTTETGGTTRPRDGAPGTLGTDRVTEARRTNAVVNRSPATEVIRTTGTGIRSPATGVPPTIVAATRNPGTNVTVALADPGTGTIPMTKRDHCPN